MPPAWQPPPRILPSDNITSSEAATSVFLRPSVGEKTPNGWGKKTQPGHTTVLPAWQSYQAPHRTAIHCRHPAIQWRHRVIQWRHKVIEWRNAFNARRCRVVFCRLSAHSAIWISPVEQKWNLRRWAMEVAIGKSAERTLLYPCHRVATSSYSAE